MLLLVALRSAGMAALRRRRRRRRGSSSSRRAPPPVAGRGRWAAASAGRRTWARTTPRWGPSPAEEATSHHHYPASSSPRPPARMPCVVAALYRSARRGARLCDCNPALRRHLLTRFVRESIVIDDIASHDDVRRLCDAPGFSLVQAVTSHFRTPRGPANAAAGGAAAATATAPPPPPPQQQQLSQPPQQQQPPQLSQPPRSRPQQPLQPHRRGHSSDVKSMTQAFKVRSA
jgi:hypothetical protein